MAKPKKKIIDTRSPKKKAKDAAFALLPPALVRSPLKRVMQSDGKWVTTKDGGKAWEAGPHASAAYSAAKLGQGQLVQGLAQDMIRKQAALT